MKKASLTRMGPQHHPHYHASGSTVASGHDRLDQGLFQIAFVFGNQMNHTGKGFRGMTTLAET